MIAELGRRLLLAWRALRRGDLQPPPAGDVDRPTVELEVERLKTTVRDWLAAAGLPARWADEATSDQLESMQFVMRLARAARDEEWTAVEEGAWPR